jgi:hypothetical protein
VLRSRPLTLATNPRVLVEWVETPGVTQGQMEQKLALELGRAYDANLEKVNAMYRAFGRALVALVVELATLVTAFAVGVF